MDQAGRGRGEKRTLRYQSSLPRPHFLKKRKANTLMFQQQQLRLPCRTLFVAAVSVVAVLFEVRTAMTTVVCKHRQMDGNVLVSSIANSLAERSLQGIDAFNYVHLRGSMFICEPGCSRAKSITPMWQYTEHSGNFISASFLHSAVWTKFASMDATSAKTLWSAGVSLCEFRLPVGAYRLSQRAYICLHGLGHGAYIRSLATDPLLCPKIFQDRSIANDAHKSALSICDEAHSIEFAYLCSSGAWHSAQQYSLAAVDCHSERYQIMCWLAYIGFQNHRVSCNELFVGIRRFCLFGMAAHQTMSRIQSLSMHPAWLTDDIEPQKGLVRGYADRAAMAHGALYSIGVIFAEEGQGFGNLNASFICPLIGVAFHGLNASDTIVHRCESLSFWTPKSIFSFSELKHVDAVELLGDLKCGECSC